MKDIFKIQLVLFALLLIFWNIFIPVLEGADELGHYCHADYIAHRNKIPNLNIIDGCFLWHPPLYYIFLAPTIKAFGQKEFTEDDFISNPNFSDLKHGQYSQFVHTKEEFLFNWTKKELLIHFLRFQSSILALGIFIITWKVSKIVFKNPLNRNLSLLIFFNPMFLHISSTLTNVTLVNFIATVLITMDFIFQKKGKSFKIYLLEGLLAGLGFITKITVLSLVFAKAFLFITNHVKLSVEKNILRIMLVILGFAATAGWYLMRSYNLYGNFIESDVIAQLPGQYVHAEFVKEIGLVNYINSLALTLFRTFWSGFGALTINFPQVVNTVLLIASFLLALSFYKNLKSANQYIKIAFYYAISIFLALILMNTKLRAMHAKDLFLAYLPFALLFSFSLSKFAQTFKKSGVDIKVQVSFTLAALYFYAQQEIVKIAKFILDELGLAGFYNAESGLSSTTFSVFFIKALVTIVLFSLVKRFLANIKITSTSIKIYSFILFAGNIVVLSVSIYLLYTGFN